MGVTVKHGGSRDSGGQALVGVTVKRHRCVADDAWLMMWMMWGQRWGVNDVSVALTLDPGNEFNLTELLGGDEA